MDYREMNRLRCAISIGLSFVAACAPKSSQPDRVDAAVPRSMVMARMGAGQDAAVSSRMQGMLLRRSLAGKVTTHGFAMPELYTVGFAGSCADNADLVTAVTKELVSAGATETSCLREDVFAPGEPISFRPTPARS
jgi:hypothetical protein